MELGYGDSSRFLDRWLNDILLVSWFSAQHSFLSIFLNVILVSYILGHDFCHISSLLSGIALHEDPGFCLDRGVANASSDLIPLLNSLQYIHTGFYFVVTLWTRFLGALIIRARGLPFDRPGI